MDYHGPTTLHWPRVRRWHNLFCFVTQASSCLSSFSEASAVFGLHISWPKTKIQNVGSGPQPPSILVDPVDSVSTFTSLGSIQSSDGYCWPDVRRRITLASSVMSSLDCFWKERRLPLPIKICVYLALVQSVLLYASETWTLTSADAKSLEAFHMKCQRRISWRQFVSNSEISALISLAAINDVIRHRRIAVFSHIARLQDNTPAHKALQSHVNLSLGRLPYPSWSRRPGRPCGRWIDQIRNTSQTTADLWRQAFGRGRHKRATRRPTLAMRWWWWWSKMIRVCVQ